jgi:glycosyltransferase involved in cell wall biosynthesis
VGAPLDERGTVPNTDSVLSPQRRRSEWKAALGPGCFRLLQSKRILTNTLALAPANGVDVHAFEMSRALAARGHSVDVVAQRDGPLREQFASFARTVSVYGDFLHPPLSLPQLRSPLTFVPWADRAVRAVVRSRRLRPDVIYANDQQALMWACATSHRPEVPIVCHLHAQVGTPMGRQRLLLARRIDTFIVSSRFIRDDWVAGGLPEDRIEVIPQAVETSSYPRATDESRRFARRALGVPADAFVTLYLGRVAPEKGVDVLVRAWNSLGLTPDEGRLLIVGPPWPWSYLEDLHRLASASCLFMDIQTHVVPLLHAADVLVLPSRWEEPFGRVIIEAMATGCPVIASRVGGIPEILIGDFASMLFGPGRAEELAFKLGEIRRGAGGALAAAGPAHVQKNFALSSAADRVERILVQATPRGWRASS